MTERGERRSDPVVIVQTGFLGDAVLATGMVRALHESGVMRIGLLVRSELAEIFEHHPAIATVHRLDKGRDGATAAMVNELRAAAYAAALVPHRSARSALLVRRAGVPRRIGFRQADLALTFTDRVHYSIAEHEIDRNAALVERLGAPAPPASRRSWLVPTDRALESMRPHEGAIVLAPGSVWATKRWREEGFVEVARRLHERGDRLLVIGGEGDRELCARIVSRAGLPPEALHAGTLTLPELVALSSVVSRVICNDSAPLHIAEAVGTPVTALFGPTVPEFGFGPVLAGSVALGVELPCRPCRIHGGPSCPIGTHECMMSITPEEVLGTIV